MAAQYLALDSFWVDKCRYDDAERAYYEGQGNEILTPLADEVARARQRLNAIRDNVEDAITSNKVPNQCGKTVEPEIKTVQGEAPLVVQPAQTVEPEKKEIKEQTTATKPTQEIETSKPPPICNLASMDIGAIKFLEKKVASFENGMQKIQKQLDAFNSRLQSLELKLPSACPAPVCKKPAPAPTKDEDDDDVDLFGSESEDDEAANKVKEERLAAYNAKKSKKPALIAKSSIILDVKPWDDETDMKALEAAVRKIEMDGLLWGASKLVPLAYGIHKLQINCVVEDEKVSIDLLQEQIEAIEDFVQSVDIAAFNKI